MGLPNAAKKLDMLAKAVKRGNEDARLSTVTQLGPYKSEALSALAEAMHDPSSRVRAEAVRLIGRCGIGNPVVLDLLSLALGDNAGVVRRTAITNIGESAQWASEFIEDFREGRRTSTILHDLMARAFQAAETVVSVLVHIVQRDEDQEARDLAINALSFIKGKEFIENLNNKVHSFPRHLRLMEIERSAAPVSPKEKIAQLFAGLPDGFQSRAVVLEQINHDYRQEVAQQLGPALNAELQAMPHNTYEEKKALAKWVNDELRRFDLAIKCPKTGQASLLLAIPGNHPEVGRFAIEHKTPEGKRVRSVTTSQLPHLDLMEANPRREALQEWRDRVGDQRGGASRA